MRALLWGDEGLHVETRTSTHALIQLYLSTSHAFMVRSQIVIATWVDVKTSRKGLCGAKRKTTPRDDAQIRRISIMDPKNTSSDIKRDVVPHGIDVDTSTVRGSLQECGCRAQRPVTKQLLIPLMKKKRVHRCRASGSMCACHAASPGLIPGQDKFPGWGFSGFFLTCKTNVGKL